MVKFRKLTFAQYKEKLENSSLKVIGETVWHLSLEDMIGLIQRKINKNTVDLLVAREYDKVVVRKGRITWFNEEGGKCYRTYKGSNTFGVVEVDGMELLIHHNIENETAITYVNK